MSATYILKLCAATPKYLCRRSNGEFYWKAALNDAHEFETKDSALSIAEYIKNQLDPWGRGCSGPLLRQGLDLDNSNTNVVGIIDIVMITRQSTGTSIKVKGTAPCL